MSNSAQPFSDKAAELDDWANSGHVLREHAIEGRGNVFDPRISQRERLALEQLISKLWDWPVTEVGRAVDELIADRARAVAGHDCLKIEEFSGGEIYAVAVQNCYSGFRVKLTRNDGVRHFASALAKSSEVTALLCSERAVGPFFTEPPVWRYAGLGIGSRLYVSALETMNQRASGDWRVGDHASNEYVGSARWKLHRHDPYSWEYRNCPDCLAVNVEWAATDRAGFDRVSHNQAARLPCPPRD